MAATDRRPIKNAPYRVYWKIVNVTTMLPISGGITVPDAEVSKDGAAFADCTDSEHEVGTSGFGYVDLTSAEMTADCVVFQLKCSNASAVTFVTEIRPEPALNSGVAQAATASSITLASTASSTDDLYNGGEIEIVNGTGKGQIRTGTDYTGSTNILTVDRPWITNPSTDSTYIIHPRVGNAQTTAIAGNANVAQIDGSTTAAENLALLYAGGVITGTINDSTPSTTSLDLDATFSADDDEYNDKLFLVLSGTGIVGASRVSDYTGSTKTVTLSPALPTAPANGDSVAILGLII